MMQTELAIAAARNPELLGGLTVEVLRAGEGDPILVLHGLHDIDPRSPFVNGLSRLGNVVAPTHPGFGQSALPKGFNSIYDLIHFYRAVLEELGGRATVVGLSFGGWIAAELAAAHAPMARLVLVDTLGVRFGDREHRDIAHLFNTDPSVLRSLAWADPARRPTGAVGLGWPTMLQELPDSELVRLHRSNDALSLYGWRPHMHNPRLRDWLPRIAVPTLVIWGEADRIVSPDYGRNIARAIPGARFEMVARAGHHPELEQPARTLDLLESFLKET